MKLFSKLGDGLQKATELLKKRGGDDESLTGFRRGNDDEDEFHHQENATSEIEFHSEDNGIYVSQEPAELSLEEPIEDRRSKRERRLNVERRENKDRRGADDVVEVKGVWYVSNINDLRNTVETVKRPKLVLRGDLTFYVLDKATSPGEDFVLQDPRIGAPALKAFFKNDAEEKIVQVWVRKAAIDILKAARLNSVTLEIDQLLRYGSKKNAKSIVLTSWHDDGNVLVQAVVFSDGFLKAVDEQKLNAARFDAGLRSFVGSLRKQYPTHEIIWVDPAENVPAGLPRDVRSEGSKAFLKLVNKPLISASGQITFGSQFKRPALILAAGAVAYAGLVSLPYQKYADEKRNYLERDAEFKSSVKMSATEFLEPGQLTVLEKKRFFMTDPRSQTDLINLMRNVITEVNAVKPKIWITDLKMGDVDGKGKQISLNLRTEADPTLSATSQVEPIIHALSKALGVSLGSSNQGIKDQTENGKTYRNVALTGSIGA